MMQIYSPIKGTIKALEDVNDDVFSQKMMGDGIAIVPEDGYLYSPIDGEVTMVFPTGHAVGLKTTDGLEILIHIGIDTVNLEGKGFKILTKAGDCVHRGDILVEFSLEIIKAAGLERDTMLILTKNEMYQTIEIMKQVQVNAGDCILELR